MKMSTSDALKIVRQLAETEPNYGLGGDYACMFCSPVVDGDVPRHADYCLIIEARKYMQWITGKSESEEHA